MPKKSFFIFGKFRALEFSGFLNFVSIIWLRAGLPVWPILNWDQRHWLRWLTDSIPLISEIGTTMLLQISESENAILNQNKRKSVEISSIPLIVKDTRNGNYCWLISFWMDLAILICYFFSYSTRYGGSIEGLFIFVAIIHYHSLLLLAMPKINCATPLVCQVFFRLLLTYNCHTSATISTFLQPDWHGWSIISILSNFKN